jgi:hypothetical protein
VKIKETNIQIDLKTPENSKLRICPFYYECYARNTHTGNTITVTVLFANFLHFKENINCFEHHHTICGIGAR